MVCTFLLIFPASALAGKGVVLLQDVCDSDKIIIGTTDGWYAAVEWYGGALLYEGMVIYGNLKTYGFQDIYTRRGRKTRVYIENYGFSMESAIEEHCT